LVRTLRKGPLSDLDNPLGYLRRAIVNLASNQRRSLGRRRRAVARLNVDESWLPSYPADVEAILDLPPKQRAILYLVEVEGVPYQEAADQIGMTTVAARAMARRAREKARLALEVSGG
jgi:DNA-directed RNA polymerase specialized sigma24 family protein